MLECRAMIKRAGILALQGDYAAHALMLENLGVETATVRRPSQLTGIEMLVLPGGESTTISMLLDISGLRAPLAELVRSGLPTLATCAGTVLVASTLLGDCGTVSVTPLGLLNATVDRNAYGRQRESFQGNVDVNWQALGVDDGQNEFPGVFIRAPQITNPQSGCDVVGTDGETIAMVRQGNLLAATFHPELSGDSRIHQAVVNFR